MADDGRWRDQAYRYLTRAVDEAGGQMRRDWWLREDPDLRALRDLHRPEWRVLVQRAGGEPAKLSELPPRPWTMALRRARAALFALVCAAVAVGVVGGLVWLGSVRLVAILVVAAVAIVAGRAALREQRLRPSGDRRHRRGADGRRERRAQADVDLARRLEEEGDREGAEQAWRDARDAGHPDALGERPDEPA